MDFEQHVDSAPKPPATVARFKALIDEAETINTELLALEAQFTGLMSRYNYIKTKELPDLMTELQTSEWVHDGPDGPMRVRLNDFVAGSLPKEPDKLAEAIRWMEDNGGKETIKSELVVPFSKSQHNAALAITDDLRQQGYAPELTSSIHASTLQAFARERLKRGEEIPLAKLGLFAGRIADIDHPKGKPTKKLSAKKKKGKDDGDDATS